MHDSMPFNHNLETVRRHYRWLAPIYPFFELVFVLPGGLRKKAVERLDLTVGDTVLEVGCGTGRNLCHLVAAVGATGQVYGVDYSEAMLGRAKKLCIQKGWHNVALLQEDAGQLELPEMVDGVLFSLSYSVMPNSRAALARAWKFLKSSKRLVIMDGKLATGIWGRLSRPFVTWLSQQTILGDPMKSPQHDLREFTDMLEIEEFNLGTYYICTASKPQAGEAGL
jgi:ubiquinone/menaquinone biosynthesis C-methylase UbiE